VKKKHRRLQADAEDYAEEKLYRNTRKTAKGFAVPGLKKNRQQYHERRQ
jgi:hypothetical protein